MRDVIRAHYICRLWHRQSIEQRQLLSDVSFEELRSDYRSRQLKAAIKLAKGSAHIPLVVERNGEQIQIW